MLDYNEFQENNDKARFDLFFVLSKIITLWVCNFKNRKIKNPELSGQKRKQSCFRKLTGLIFFIAQPRAYSNVYQNIYL